MKHFRKLFSCMAASAMVMSLASFTGTKVHAENGYTLTIRNSDESAFANGYSFAAYQILKGDVMKNNPKDNDGKRTLSNIKWGESVTDEAKADKDIGSDAKAFVDKLTDESAAETMAKKLANTKGYLSAYRTSGTISKDGKSYTFSGLPGGYYLVKDTTDNKWKNDATSGHIVEVVGDTDTETKKSVPTTIKKVKENTKTVTDIDDDNIPGLNVGEKYNDVADYDIGDQVPFELIGTLPADYDKYGTYYYQFTDTMDSSFTLDKTSVKAYYTTDNGTKWTEITSGFTTSEPVANKDGSKKSFTVTFADLKTATSSLPASSKIKVAFDATLNENAKIGLPGNENESYLTFSNDVNSNSHGKTAPDKVVVFTYELDTTKVDESDTAKTLEGAHFIVLDSNGENPKYLVQNKDNEGKVTNNSWTSEKSKATDFISGKEGKFAIKGLDDGTYYLQETKAPDGYNTDSTLHEVTINASTSNGQGWDGSTDALTALSLGTVENSGDAETGIVSDQITNSKGSNLPSTGGMGTTLLYVAGGILVACAAAYVVMSRKHSTNK